MYFNSYTGVQMARSSILSPTIDPISDSGAVLWSLVQGEQLEFPVTLSFLNIVSSAYTFEAAIMEAANIAGFSDIPTYARAGGINNELNVRIPLYRGQWTSGATYNQTEVVYVAAVTSYYSLSTPSGSPLVSTVQPNLDTNNWVQVSGSNIVYIQFPGTLSNSSTTAITSNWTAGSIQGIFSSTTIHNLGANTPITFSGTPPTGILSTVNATSFVIGNTYKILTVGTTDFTQLGASSNSIGTTFIATAVGVGTGTATMVYYVTQTNLSSLSFSVSNISGGLPLYITSAGSGLSITVPQWSVQPTTQSSIYGFFELRVTEPVGGTYQRTWKPMRGLIEFSFSPTNLI
jgi:hypothetical protein